LARAYGPTIGQHVTNPFMPQQQPAAPAHNPFAPAAPQQPQYTQQPAQNPYAPAQQAAQQAAAPQFNGFMKPGEPPAVGAGNMPKVSDLQGRLLLVMPERVERNVPSRFQGRDGGVQYQDKMTCTVIVLDGGPLQWGGTQPGSARQQQQVPYVVKGMWIQQKGLVAQLEDALALRQQGGPGIVLGRLWKTGTAQNDPYVLAEPQPQDEQVAQQYVSHTNPFTV
jgi:hypothetical protein